MYPATAMPAIKIQRTIELRSMKVSGPLADARAGRGGGGGRVVTAGVKRVALTQAHDRKQAAPQNTVPFDACHGVARARGLEAADVAQERRKHRPVELDEPDEEAGDHRRSRPG